MSNCVHTLEQYAATGGVVDREAKVIRGVKVLGLESRNPARVLGLDRREFGSALDAPYRYDPEAIKRAIGLYEGCSVNLDHLEAAYTKDGQRVITGTRKFGERFGRLVNVRFEDGLVADLEYLASHPQADAVCEAAERMPEQLALSHHAECEFRLIGNQAVATAIDAVKSVDLIGERPGTTRTLFESADAPAQETTSMQTFQELLEGATDAEVKRFLSTAIEMDPGYGPMVMDVQPEQSPEELLNAAFKAMITAVLDDTSLDLAAKQAKIGEILKAQQAATDSVGGSPATDSEGEAAPQESQAKVDPATAQLTLENARLKKELATRELCEKRGVKITCVSLKAMTALESIDEQNAFLNEFVKVQAPKPRAAEQGTAYVPGFDKPMDTKAFAQSCRR